MSSRSMQYNDDWSCYANEHSPRQDLVFVDVGYDDCDTFFTWSQPQPKKKKEVIYPFRSRQPKFWETMPEDMFADYIPPEEPLY